MPPKEKRITAEEIIDVFLDPRVIDAIGKALNPSFCQMVERSIESKLAPIVSSVQSLVDRMHQVEERMGRLSKDNVAFAEENAILKKQLKDLSNYSRRDNLIIQGLDIASFSETAASSGGASLLQTGGTLESSNAATEKAVVSLAQSMGLDITTDDISVAHRLPTKSASRTSLGASSNSPRSPAPIIVKFVKRRTRDMMYGARKQLKTVSPGVYINEHLTAENASLHKTARALCKQKKIFSTWTAQGEVFAKMSSLADSRPMKITQLSDLPA